MTSLFVNGPGILGRKMKSNKKQVQSIEKNRTGLYSCLACLIIIVFILTGCAGNNRIPQPDPAGQTRSNIIYSVRYEDHSGIIIDRQKAAPYLTVLQKEFPDALYLEFGWGDLEWYKTDVGERNSLLGIKALFTSTPSGMFVWSLPKHPEKQYPDDRLTKIHISDTEFEKDEKVDEKVTKRVDEILHPKEDSEDEVETVKLSGVDEEDQKEEEEEESDFR